MLLVTVVDVTHLRASIQGCLPGGAAPHGSWRLANHALLGGRLSITAKILRLIDWTSVEVRARAFIRSCAVIWRVSSTVIL